VAFFTTCATDALLFPKLLPPVYDGRWRVADRLRRSPVCDAQSTSAKVVPSATVPEPATFALAGGVLLMMAARKLRGR
jgi:hypothetical protein